MRTMSEILAETMAETGRVGADTDLNQNSAMLLSDLCNFSPLEGVAGELSPGDERQQRRETEDDGSREEREERSAALERTYVYDVYEQIAPHFRDSHHRPWPRVQQFLAELEPGSLVCDVGCGNGKYLGVNADVFTLGVDRCQQLGEVASERGHEVTAADNMALPFRDECFDAALSVAVVHHFATTERRVQALRELARVLRIGGRLMITVWALEQRHRKFESQDVLVPWHKPLKSSSEDQTSLEKEITSTTTSDDDILNYHAYTSGMESEPYFVPACFPRKKHRFRDGWVRYRGKNLESCRSSSQSSSDLSSPNETCYSFVRRALQKLSSGGGGGKQSWDDPHTRCRPPWFLQSADSIGSAGSRAGGCRSSVCSAGGGHMLDEKRDSLDSNENADDIPIELHDLDNEMFEDVEFERRGSSRDSYRGSSERSRHSLTSAVIGTGTLPATNTNSTTGTAQAKSSSSKYLQRSTSTDSQQPPLVTAHKSKSLGDILSLFGVNFLQPRKASADLTTNNSDTTSSSISLRSAKLSSTSSVDSRTAPHHFRSSTSGGAAGSTVTRSKSSHLTLAKVEEDGEQMAGQTGNSVLSSPNRKCSATGQQQRWSVAGYPATCAAAHPTSSDDLDVQGASKRPRSLVLGYEMHIPRTLSAEDHKNGNTILPDFDGCLGCYSLSGAGGTSGIDSVLSPPYTKVSDVSQDDVSKLTLDNNKKNTKSTKMGTDLDPAQLARAERDRIRQDKHRQHLQQCLNKTFELPVAAVGDSDVAKITNESDHPGIGNEKSKSHHPPAEIFVPTSDGILQGSVEISGENNHKTNVTTTEFHKWPCSKQLTDVIPASPSGSVPAAPAINTTATTTTTTSSTLTKCADVWQDLFFSNLITFLINREHLFPYRSMPNLNAGICDGNMSRSDCTDDLTSYVTSYPMTPQDGGVLGAALSGKINKQATAQPRRRFSQPCTLDHLHDLKSNIALYSSQGINNSNEKTSFGDAMWRNGYNRRRSVFGDMAKQVQQTSSVTQCRNLQRPLLRRKSYVCDSVTARERHIKHSYSADDTDLKCSILTVDSVGKHIGSAGGHHIMAKEDSLQSDTSADSDDSVASVIVVQRNRVPSVDLPSPPPPGGDTVVCCGSGGMSGGRSERFGSACSKDSSNHSDTSVESEESCISVIPMPDKEGAKCTNGSDCEECDLGTYGGDSLPCQPEMELITHEDDVERVGMEQELLDEVPAEKINSDNDNGKESKKISEIEIENVIAGEMNEKEALGVDIRFEERDLISEHVKANNFIKDYDIEKQNSTIQDSIEVDRNVEEQKNDPDIVDEQDILVHSRSEEKIQDTNNLLFLNEKWVNNEIFTPHSKDRATQSRIHCSSPLSDNRYMDLKLVEGSFEDEDDEETVAYDHLAEISESRCSSFDDDTNTCQPIGMRSSVSWEKYLDACESLVLDSIFYVNAGHTSNYSDQQDSISTILPSLCPEYEMSTVLCHNSQVAMTAEACWLDPTSSSGATDSWKSSDSIADDDASELDGLHSLSDDLLDDELRLDISHEPAVPEVPLANSPQGRLLEAAVGVANSLQSTVTVAIASSLPRKQVGSENVTPQSDVGTLDLFAVPSSVEDDSPVAMAAQGQHSLPLLLVDTVADIILKPQWSVEENSITGSIDTDTKLADSQEINIRCIGDTVLPPPQSEETYMVDLPLRNSFNSSLEDEDIGAREEMASDDEEVFALNEVVVDSENEFEVLATTSDQLQVVKGDVVKEETLQLQKRQVCEDMINGNIPGNRKLLKQMAQECGLSWAALKGIDGLNLGLSESRSSSSCGGGSPRRKSDSEAVELSVKLSTGDGGVGAGHHQPMCRGKSLEFSSLAFHTRNSGHHHHHIGNKGGGATCGSSSLECAPMQYQIQEEEESMSRSNASSSDMTASLESSCRMFDLVAGESSIPQSPLATTTLAPVKMTSPPCEIIPSTCMSMSIESRDSLPPVGDEPAEIVAPLVVSECDLMQTSMASSIENHFGNLEFVTEANGGTAAITAENEMPAKGRHHHYDAVTTIEDGGQGWHVDKDEEPDQRDSLSISTSDDSILSGSENGGSATYHRYYHVFREGELDHLIDKYVENLHIISSYYDHANWCIIAEKVQVWRI